MMRFLAIYVNALNGLFYFYTVAYLQEHGYDWQFQRPERAFFISTKNATATGLNQSHCVNALSRLFYFYIKIREQTMDCSELRQRPEQAFLISTVQYFDGFAWLIAVSTP